MSTILPTRKQWKSWSKPTKYQFIGLIVAVLALFSVPQHLSRLFSEPKAQSYAADRIEYIRKLDDASTCFAARLYVDQYSNMQSNCKVDIKGLSNFFKTFAPYLATTPYSGAENLEYYSRKAEFAAEMINNVSTRKELIDGEKRLGVSLAEVGYHLCGIEWYLRLSPSNQISNLSQSRVESYQRAWLSWLRYTKSDFRHAFFSHNGYSVTDDPDCSSFMGLID